MIDPELKEHLLKIEEELVLFRGSYTGLRPTLLRGIFHGAGYVIGVVLIIIIVGWILNIIGVIPAFNSFVNEFRTALDKIGSIK